jgi:hypothetical protein
MLSSGYSTVSRNKIKTTDSTVLPLLWRNLLLISSGLILKEEATGSSKMLVVFYFLYFNFFFVMELCPEDGAMNSGHCGNFR